MNTCRGLVYILVGIILSSACSSQDNSTDSPSNKVKQAEVNNLDKFHKLSKGKANPGDHDYHKGTYLESKVGLQKDDKLSVTHPRNPDEMIVFYSKRLIESPDDVNLWIMLGVAYQLKNMYDEAIFYYDKAIGIDTNNLDANSNKGFTLLDKGNIDKAIEYFQKTISINKEYANSYYGLALAYERLNRITEAITASEDYIRLAKKDMNKNKRWIAQAEINLKRLKGELETKKVD